LKWEIRIKHISDIKNQKLKTKQTTDKHRCTQINKENNSLNKFRNLFQSLKFPVKKENNSLNNL